MRMTTDHEIRGRELETESCTGALVIYGYGPREDRAATESICMSRSLRQAFN